MQETKRTIKEFDHYKDAVKYSKRENWMRFFMFMVLLSFIGIIVSIVIRNIYVLFFCVIGYFSFLIIAFLVLQVFMRKRQKLINSFNSNDFDDYLNNLLEEYNPLVADVLVYGLWKYIQNNELLREMFNSGTYEDAKFSNEIKRNCLIASFFRCITYQDCGKTYRIPKFFKSAEKMKEVMLAYENLYNDMDKSDKTPFIPQLKSMEQKYIDDKNEAKDKKWTLFSSGWLKEAFTVFANDEKGIYVLKNLIAISSLIIMIFHALIDNSEFNKFATFVFEGITVFLLFVDVTKDKDYDYLH